MRYICDNCHRSVHSADLIKHQKQCRVKSVRQNKKSPSPRVKSPQIASRSRVKTKVIKKTTVEHRALRSLRYIKHDVITDAEIEQCFAEPSLYKKFHRFGRLIQEKLTHVQLISQIEAENGQKSYHLLKAKLGEYATLSKGSSVNGYALLKDLDIYGYHRAVIALYAVWTSVYHYGPEDSSYWDNFYEGLRYGKSRSGKTIGNGFKRLLAEYKYLVTFEKYDESTSRRHVSPIWLHGLPQKYLEHFIESCVLTDALQRHSVEGQRSEWLNMLRHEVNLSQVLTLFFEYGGDAAYTLTRALMELRDQWNERGTLSTDVGIPSYMVESFVNVLNHGAVQRHTRYHLRPQIKPPYLALDLDRFLQPFLCLPPRPWSQQTLHLEVSARDRNFKEIRTVTLQSSRTDQAKGEYLSHGVFDLLVPPSTRYTLKLSKKETQEISTSPDFMAFDATTGKLVNLYQDTRWPAHMVVLLHSRMVWVSTDGRASGLQQLRGTWEHWKYLHLRDASTFELKRNTDERSFKFFTKHTVSRLNFSLKLQQAVPYWVHVSNGIQIVSDLKQARFEVKQGKSYASLALFKPGTTYPLQRNNKFKDGQSLESWLNTALTPGLYTLRLSQGMQTVSQRFLFLPHAYFERSPKDCVNTSAQTIGYRLPNITVRSQGNWKEGKDKVMRWQQPNIAAVKIELFPDTLSSTFLYLVLQDLRWRRYGHAHLPQLSHMHTSPETFTPEALKALPDSRLRIEVEPPLLSVLKRPDDKVPVEVREGKKIIFSSDFAVHYHNYAYWDVNLKDMLKTALQIAPKAKSLTIGVQLKQFIPIVYIQQPVVVPFPTPKEEEEEEEEIEVFKIPSQSESDIEVKPDIEKEPEQTAAVELTSQIQSLQPKKRSQSLPWQEGLLQLKTQLTTTAPEVTPSLLSVTSSTQLENAKHSQDVAPLTWQESLQQFKEKLTAASPETELLLSRLNNSRQIENNLDILFQQLELSHQILRKLKKSQSKKVWLYFLHALHYQPDILYDFMGKSLFTHLSPFAENRRITALYTHAANTDRINFRVSEDVLHQIFRQKQLSAHAFYELVSPDQAGMSDLLLFQHDRQAYFHLQRYEESWVLCSDWDEKTDFRTINDKLILMPQFPVNLWVKPEGYFKCKRAKPELSKYTQRALESLVQTGRKQITHYLNKAQRIQQSTLIPRWMSYRLDKQSQSPLESLEAILGAMAILKRMSAEYERLHLMRLSTVIPQTKKLYTHEFNLKVKAQAQREQLSQNKSQILALCQSLEGLLKHEALIELRPWISQKLTLDAIVAEYFFHWYIDCKIAQVQWASPATLKEIFQ